MIRVRAFVLAVGLALGLAGAAAAQDQTIAASPDKRFEGVYGVTASIGTVGEFTYRFSQSAQAYEASAERRFSGMARMMAGSSQDYTYSVQGSVAESGRLQPVAYRHQGGRRNRVVEARFSPDDIVTTATPHMGMGSPAATQAQKRGAVDQLTAIASLVTADGDPCARTIPVYMDGRSRFDFVMRPNGTVNVNTEAYRGQAIRCSVQFRPIAGFSDPQEPATLTFLFARTPSGLFAPIRIQMPSDDAGVITLEARRLTVNGARLR